MVVDINENVDCGICQFPIKYSEFIHDLSAGVFFGGLTVTDMVYTSKQILQEPDPHESYPFDIFLFGLAVINCGVLVTFFVINKIIMRYQWGHHDARLRACSFLMECLSGALVILIATVTSMKRNRNITWLE